MYLADTNILLRFLLRNDLAYPTIRQAVRSLKSRREQLVTTPQNIAEFWNVCTRPTTARGGLGLSIEATERRVRLLERHFRFPSTAIREMLGFCLICGSCDDVTGIHNLSMCPYVPKPFTNPIDCGRKSGNTLPMSRSPITPTSTSESTER